MAGCFAGTDLLIKAGLLNSRGHDCIDLTDLGEQVADRLRDGGSAPEIQRVLEAD
jgi:hypothetical protein